MHPYSRLVAVLGAVAVPVVSQNAGAAVLGGVDLGNLTNYHMVFTDGNEDANWQGASKGFVGDVAVNGILANERTSGTVPYAGTLYTNAATQGAWQGILDANVGQAFGSASQVSRLTGLNNDLTSAFAQIDALTATPGFTSVASTALNGLNTQNGIGQTIVVNITSGFSVSSQINITGDASDVFILRWDTDALSANGYQGEVKFQSGGGVVPLGGLTPGNFVNVAGDINSSGGGSNPAALQPYLDQIDAITGGTAVNGGGFFTGYWLTTGDPITRDANNTPDEFGQTGSLSNAIFVGGWYTNTDKFSMTSGTSGVYVPPVPEPASAALAALALGALGLTRGRRHRQLRCG